MNTNTYAANIGLVGRYVSTRRCRILGVNAYYDYRGGCLKNWHQIGAGIEALGRRVEFRANGYYPLGDREHKRTRRFDFEGGFFEVCRKFEIAYMGFNTELGYFMAKSRKGSIYAAVGPYYLSGGCHRESWGGKGRLRFQFKDWMSLEFDASHDSIFETVFQGQIVFSFPFYAFSSKDKKWPCGILNRQVYQPVERIDIIPLTRRRCFKSNF